NRVPRVLRRAGGTLCAPGPAYNWRHHGARFRVPDLTRRLGGGFDLELELRSDGSGVVSRVVTRAPRLRHLGSSERFGQSHLVLRLNCRGRVEVADLGVVHHALPSNSFVLSL